MTYLYGFLSVLIGYLIGAISPSYLIGKLHGFDIRERGSGNAGASNALITLGKGAAVFIAIFDIAKGAGAVLLARFLFPDLELAGTLAGTFCILGHIFPFYMKFRGGKGLASLAGVALALDPLFFLILLGVEVVLALVVNYICVIPITGSILFTVFYGITTKNIIGILLWTGVSAIIIFKHRLNLRRIREGTEYHLSLLWNRKKEEERVSANKAKNEEKNTAGINK